MIIINPRRKTARNVGISVVVLLLLLVGGGVGYTYFLGPDASQNAAAEAPPPASPTSPLFTPSKPAANARVGASVQTLTSPVVPGSNASISVKTNAGSKCTVSVIYDKAASTDSGLAPKAADEYGTVTWTWTVDKTAALGTWPVNVTCVYNTKSAVVRGDLQVIKAEPDSGG